MKQQILKQHPYTDISKFEFLVDVNKERNVTGRNMFLKYKTDGTEFNIHNSTFIQTWRNS